MLSHKHRSRIHKFPAVIILASYWSWGTYHLHTFTYIYIHLYIYIYIHLHTFTVCKQWPTVDVDFLPWGSKHPIWWSSKIGDSLLCRCPLPFQWLRTWSSSPCYCGVSSNTRSHGLKIAIAAMDEVWFYVLWRFRKSWGSRGNPKSS